MSERGPDDRERLGRNPGDAGRSDPGYSGRSNPDAERAEYERGRADAMQHSDQGRGGYPQGSHTQGSRGTGWGIAALIVSILGFLLSFVGLLSLVLSVPGLILGIVARRKGSRGMGLTSIILSVLAIIISIVITVVAGAILLNSPEFQQMLEQQQ